MSQKSSPGVLWAGAVVASALVGCLAEVGADGESTAGRSDEVVADLLDMGFGPEEVEVQVRDRLVIEDGSLVLLEAQEEVVLQGDIVVTDQTPDELLAQMLADNEDPVDKHWVSNFRVTSNTTICVHHITQITNSPWSERVYGAYKLTTAQRNGLAYAVDDYSGLNLALRFRNREVRIVNESLVVDQSGCDHTIFVSRNPSLVPDGRAGFPTADGSPCTDVSLSDSLDNRSYDINEHVVKHELGHCIGFYHSDWKSRPMSCGGSWWPVSENIQNAARVSGTPDITTDSIMETCTRTDTDGEFRGKDVTALTTIY